MSKKMKAKIEEIVTNLEDKGVSVTRNKDIELPGMPERDECGNEATRYVAMLEDIDALKMKANHQADVLMQAMNKTNRRFIKVKNRTITISHLEEQFKLKVSKG